jgi:hypothetical protein
MEGFPAFAESEKACKIIEKDEGQVLFHH